MESSEFKNMVKLQEKLLKAQLSVVRGTIRQLDGEVGDKERKYRKDKSKISYIKDILLAAQQPLHISEIIRRAAEQFNMVLDRESMVSALTKKVKRGDTFVRIKPNTFGLKSYREKKVDDSNKRV